MSDHQTAPMGATVVDGGVTFRVWAPHADAVSVVGGFNDWNAEAGVLEPIGDGQWAGLQPSARARDEYQFHIVNGDREFTRIDPYAREVTNSVGNGIVASTDYDWGEHEFRMTPMNELVVYEMHVGTFNRLDDQEVGTFASAEAKLDYLVWLGVNAIELMPTAEFAGDLSWGYNPAHIFAIESAYGGPDALKHLVKTAHEKGIAVIMDVVYNHFGPSDLDIWQFDGWSENDKGGIYFYNDHRSETPWGDSRPDYGRAEVRQFIRDNARMWIEEYRLDGLRYDMTLYMRSIHGVSDDIEEGWTLAQWINDDIRRDFPGKVLIAEDLRSNRALTQPKDRGGACFSSQWDEEFVHPVRAALSVLDDAERDLDKIVGALLNRYNDDAFERVVYTESHDEVANGKMRLPSEIDAESPDSWHAERRSSLGALLVFTSPGIPMIFQGQEFLRDQWFDDARAIDWEVAGDKDRVMALYRDLIRLRRNVDGASAGLSGQHTEVLHVNHEAKVLAFRRFRDDGSGELLVVLNFANAAWDHYRVGVPGGGQWHCRFNNSSPVYAEQGSAEVPATLTVEDIECDGRERSVVLSLPAYGGLVYALTE